MAIKAINSFIQSHFSNWWLKILFNWFLDLKKLLIDEHDLLLKNTVVLLTIKGNQIVQKNPWTMVQSVVHVANLEFYR